MKCTLQRKCQAAPHRHSAGQQLAGCKYRLPLGDGRGRSVLVGGDYVTADSGTGLVHSAPGHGQEDYIVSGPALPALRALPVATTLNPEPRPGGLHHKLPRPTCRNNARTHALAHRTCKRHSCELLCASMQNRPQRPFALLPGTLSLTFRLQWTLSLNQTA